MLVGRAWRRGDTFAGNDPLIAALNAAYELLSDEDRRHAFDRDLDAAQVRPPVVRLRRSGIGPLARTKFVANHTDFYHLLRVDRDADAEIIALAYGVLSGQASGPRAEAVFLRGLLRDAYHVLGNPQRRAMYDVSIGIGKGSPDAPAAPAEETGPLDEEQAQPASDPAAPGVRDDDLTAAEALPGSASDAAPVSVPAVYLRVDPGPGSSAEDAVPVESVAGPLVPAPDALVPQRGRKLIDSVRDAAITATGIARSEARIGLRAKAAPAEDVQQRLLTLQDGQDGAEISPAPRWHPDYGATVAGAELIFIDGPRAGARVPLGHEAVTIGSAYEADVMLPDDAGDVAPQHARIWQHGERFVFRQIAENGTLVGGQSLALPLVMLDDGDEIQIGRHRMRFSLAAR